MSNQLIQKNSQNLQIQSYEPVKLSRFANSKEELDIIEAVENSVMIGKLFKQGEDGSEAILRLVAKWRYLVGLPKDPDLSEELVMVTEFIIQNYATLTLNEIELAINLSLTRKLNDCEFKGFFSANYVSSVLSSYLYYRKIRLSDAVRKKEKHDLEQQEQSNKPTPEQQAQNFRDIFIDFYNQAKKDNEIRDPFNIAYNFLRHKLSLFSKVKKQLIEDAQKYGKAKMLEEKSRELMKWNSEAEDLAIKRYAKNFVATDYLLSIENFEEFLDTYIIPENFN